MLDVHVIMLHGYIRNTPLLSEMLVIFTNKIADMFAFWRLG